MVTTKGQLGKRRKRLLITKGENMATVAPSCYLPET